MPQVQQWTLQAADNCAGAQRHPKKMFAAFSQRADNLPTLAGQTASAQLRGCGLILEQNEEFMVNGCFKKYTERESKAQAAQIAAETAHCQSVRRDFLRIYFNPNYNAQRFLSQEEFLTVFRRVYPFFILLLG